MRPFLRRAFASAARGIVVAAGAVLALLGAPAAKAQASCGFFERSISFADGTQACLADFPFLQRRGLIANEPDATFASKVKSSSTYAVAITSTPQACPFASYMAWNWSGHDDKEALPRCDARLAESVPRGTAEGGCRCEVVLINGRSPLTREAFTARLAQAERQVIAGGQPLGRVAAESASPAAGASPAPAEPTRIALAERGGDASRQIEQQRQAEVARQAEAERQAQADRKATADRAAEAERRAEAQRKADAERQALADRKAAAERAAEAERRAEAQRKADAERQALADRKAAAERAAEAERRAEAQRKADAERQALADRKAAADRAAEAERRAEAQRKADAERQALADRQAAAERAAEAERRADAQRKADQERQAEAARTSEAERLRAEARAAGAERAKLDREMAELRRKLDEQTRAQEAAAARLSSPSAYANRVALIVGNKQYVERQLANPANDARALRQRLQTLGFRVLYFEDVKVEQIGDVYEQLHTTLQANPGSAFVFYYAGHGMQIDGENFLPSVDAKILSRFHMPSQSLDVARIVRIAESAKSTMRLLILDACRDNPWQMASRGAAKGLNRFDPAEGTLILHATRPGSVALDESRGPHGLFTFHLLRHFDTPGVPVERMFKLVAADVRSDSGGRQVPWIEGQLVGDFAFVER